MMFFWSSLVAVLALTVKSRVRAELSDTCAAEIAALENNTALQNEFGNLLEEIKVDADQTDGCDANSLTDYNCTLEFTGDSSSYEALCAGAGGQIYQDTLRLDCKFAFDTLKIEFDIMDIPICVGGSCDLTTLDHDDLNGTIAEFEKGKDRLRSEGHCKVDSAASFRGVAMGVLVATTAVLVSVLL